MDSPPLLPSVCEHQRISDRYVAPSKNLYAAGT
jgi:hypothetical protein